VRAPFQLGQREVGRNHSAFIEQLVCVTVRKHASIPRRSVGGARRSLEGSRPLDPIKEHMVSFERRVHNRSDRSSLAIVLAAG
jgi:hypothetical protein